MTVARNMREGIYERTADASRCGSGLSSIILEDLGKGRSQRRNPRVAGATERRGQKRLGWGGEREAADTPDICFRTWIDGTLCDAASTTIGYGSISPGSPARNPRPKDNQELPSWLRRGAAADSYAERDSFPSSPSLIGIHYCGCDAATLLTKES